MKIYVGNVSPEVTVADLHKLFAAHGRVESAEVVRDKVTGSSSGFGFVLMPSRPAALEATAALHGYNLKGQILEVKEVRVPPRRPPGQIHHTMKDKQRRDRPRKDNRASHE
jgi:RNA recognition motif-containing protein